MYTRPHCPASLAHTISSRTIKHRVEPILLLNCICVLPFETLLTLFSSLDKQAAAHSKRI